MSTDDIEVRHGRQTLVASGNTVTIDGKDTYDLTAVSAVAFDTFRSFMSASYQGTHFKLEFKQDTRSRSFLFFTDSKDTNLDAYRVAWEAIANRIYAIAIPRIANEIVARLRSGEKVSFGSLGAWTVALTPEGVKQGGLFGKVLPWSAVTRTDMDQGKIRILARKSPGAEEKAIGGALVGEWNIYALPTVVSLLKAQTGVSDR